MKVLNVSQTKHDFRTDKEGPYALCVRQVLLLYGCVCNENFLSPALFIECKLNLTKHTSKFSRAFTDCDPRSDAIANDSYNTQTNNSGARDMSPHVWLLTPGPKI